MDGSYQVVADALTDHARTLSSLAGELGATTDTTEAGAFAEETLRLLESIKTGEWVKPSITGGDLAALAATMRPIDELSGAGLDWLVPYVQPLQDVLDGVAGN